MVQKQCNYVTGLSIFSSEHIPAVGLWICPFNKKRPSSALISAVLLFELKANRWIQLSDKEDVVDSFFLSFFRKSVFFGNLVTVFLSLASFPVSMFQMCPTWQWFRNEIWCQLQALLSCQPGTGFVAPISSNDTALNKNVASTAIHWPVGRTRKFRFRVEYPEDKQPLSGASQCSLHHTR